ncbi:Hypothetical predicted protein [Olea europaea subsp. europaea]|uniref:Uncharacterized protein n=1 Tax=Olea europaea subsp. europaea TaxID=158383 RepID=A0A8S0TFK2_OLEEU|nr:Hypothetical predicted protein [Olea europaea subsp. europaea]
MMKNPRPMMPWVEGEQFCDEADSSRGDDLDVNDTMGSSHDKHCPFPTCGHTGEYRRF